MSDGNDKRKIDLSIHFKIYMQLEMNIVINLYIYYIIHCSRRIKIGIYSLPGNISMKNSIMAARGHLAAIVLSKQLKQMNMQANVCQHLSVA